MACLQVQLEERPEPNQRHFQNTPPAYQDWRKVSKREKSFEGCFFPSQ